MKAEHHATVVQRLASVLPLLGSFACASPGSPAPPEQREREAEIETVEPDEARPTPKQPRLVVHEWGTFTARVDGRGNLQSWEASDRVEPLPTFVFESWVTPAKQNARGTVRMETPVLYFYADEPTQASAKVEFPGGFLTEWYPSAIHQDTVERASLSWPSFTIVPGPDPEYPVSGDSHYYAARETDASPLEVVNGDTIEREKLLFYRGVGSFALPLEGSVGKTGIELVPTTELQGVIVVHRRGDALGFEVVGTLARARILSIPALDDRLEDLTNELQRSLIAQGLYEREAAAMLATWQALWFEDGLRVLYMVPRELTDRTLPLTLEPTPDELVRVLVGRLDFSR